MDDFYDLLDVDPDADESELKQAYRRLARQYHPDVNDDPRANAQFKTARRAYEILTDAEERRLYDQMGHAAYVSEKMDGYPTMGAPESGSRWTDSPTEESGSSSARTAEQSVGGSTTQRTHSESTAASDDDRFDPDAFDGDEFDRTYGDSKRMLPPTSPLLGGWVAVLLAGVAYAAGMAQYLAANAEPLASFVAAVSTSPGAALGSFGFTVPLTFLQTSLDTAGPALLFPVGLVALPVVFGTVVLKFGQRTAYLYLLGALAPLAVVAGGAIVPNLLALAVVVGFVLLPFSGTLLFLGDVGRYLAATR